MRTRRLLGPLTVCLAVALAAPAGCGGDDDGGGGNGDAVSAADFADDLCGRLSEFAGQAKKSLDKEGVKDVLGEGAPAPDITQMPKIIGAFTKMFGDLDGQFASLADDLRGIGVPDVEGGTEFRTTLIDAMNKGAGLMSQVARKLKDTNPDSLGDLSALKPAFDDFNKALAEVSIDPDEKAPKAVADAMKESQACKDFEKEYGEL